MKLTSLGLSARHHNELMMAGIDTVEKLIEVTDKELLRITPLSAADVRQIRWAQKRLVAKHPSLRDSGQEEDGLTLDIGTDRKNESQSAKQKLEPVKENWRPLTYLNKLIHKIATRLRDMAKRMMWFIAAQFKVSASSGAETAATDNASNGSTDRDEFFEWPDTDGPGAKYDFRGDFFWFKTGWLSFVGYRVGRSGKDSAVRYRILDCVFNNVLPNVESKIYMDEWGKPRSPKRLKKMADALASFTRNAKRRRDNMSKAIEHWESDLAYLKRKYYVGKFGFEWPKTDF